MPEAYGKRKNVARPDAEKTEEMRGFNANQLAAIKREALADLFFLGKGILGYNGLEPHVVGPLAHFVQTERRKTRLMLMPRGHLKTTLATITHGVQIGCADSTNNNLLVVNEIHDNAVDIVSEILGHFENNEMLRLLFPDIIPEKFSGPGVKWSATRGANLIQRAGKKDPSYLAAGIKTAVTSKHFNHLKFDDLVGFDANGSPAELQYAIRYVNNITPLTMGPDDTIVDFIGTRWGLTDLYAYLMELYGMNMAVFRRGMTEDGQAIWPEKYTPAAIAQLMKSPDVYYAQYDNDPLNTVSTDFQADKIGYWTQKLERVIYDWKGIQMSTPIRDLRRIITIDPNAGKKTSKDEVGLTVTGVDFTDARLCLEDASDRYTPDGLIDKALYLAEKWNANIIGVEEAGQQNTEFYLRKYARKRGLFVRIVPVKHGNKDKHSRILKSLQPLVADGCVYLHASQTALRKQFVEFGGGLDDRIDAFSYHTHLVTAPLEQAKRQEREDAVQKVLAMRSSRTGY